MMSAEIRKIKKEDDPFIRDVIKTVFEEFGINRPGTAYYDEALNHMSDLLETSGSIYYIVKIDGKIVGGGGVFPTNGLPEDTCELIKMYLLPEARGLGLGKTLIEKCLSFATEYGYRKMYLESMPELNKAVKTYEGFGFSYLPEPMGNTGHYSCSIRMIKEL
jgi:putative acetyltransferase